MVACRAQPLARTAAPTSGTSLPGPSSVIHNRAVRTETGFHTDPRTNGQIKGFSPLVVTRNAERSVQSPARTRLPVYTAGPCALEGLFRRGFAQCPETTAGTVRTGRVVWKGVCTVSAVPSVQTPRPNEVASVHSRYRREAQCTKSRSNRAVSVHSRTFRNATDGSAEEPLFAKR